MLKLLSAPPSFRPERSVEPESRGDGCGRKSCELDRRGRYPASRDGSLLFPAARPCRGFLGKRFERRGNSQHGPLGVRVAHALGDGARLFGFLAPALGRIGGRASHRLLSRCFALKARTIRRGTSFRVKGAFG